TGYTIYVPEIELVNQDEFKGEVTEFVHRMEENPEKLQQPSDHSEEFLANSAHLSTSF
ncbi:hypothetical protein AVEN_153795-1, partial [Araneus ventricosus]